jgi:hypothetical protein
MANFFLLNDNKSVNNKNSTSNVKVHHQPAIVIHPCTYCTAQCIYNKMIQDKKLPYQKMEFKLVYLFLEKELEMINQSKKTNVLTWNEIASAIKINRHKHMNTTDTNSLFQNVYDYHTQFLWDLNLIDHTLPNDMSKTSQSISKWFEPTVSTTQNCCGRLFF